jgi:hypothetical protein
MTDIGVITRATVGGAMVLGGSYFENKRVNETVTKNGLTVTFTGWTYSIRDYSRALEEAGLLIERLREPAPTDEQASRRPSLAFWQRLPHFLSIRALKPG